MELQYKSIQNRLNYIPEFLSKKLMKIHSSVVDSTEKIDRCQNSFLKGDLEKEKANLEVKKRELKAKFQRKAIVAEAKLRELRSELLEEEQSHRIILACIDGIRKKNEQNRDAFSHRQQLPQVAPTEEEFATPSQEFLYFEEEKHPNFTNESMNKSIHMSQDHQPLYDVPQQQPPPWFRMVKRRKVIDEYNTTREYKSATQILVEQEHEWSEVRYSPE
jgi:hypothetical protein